MAFLNLLYGLQWESHSNSKTMMIILFLPPTKRSIKAHNDNSLLMPSHQWCYDSIIKVQSLFIYHVLNLMYLLTNIALYVCHDHIYYLLISLLFLLFESRDEILLRGVDL
jgi:hypothetical protein